MRTLFDRVLKTVGPSTAIKILDSLTMFLESEMEHLTSTLSQASEARPNFNSKTALRLQVLVDENRS